MALSRIAAVILGLMAASPVFAGENEDVLARYAQKTSVVTRCTTPQGDAIIVCGRRAADRWRVPYLNYDAGDPRAESVMGERERLQHKNSNPCANLSQFLIGCGMVGVTVSTRFDGTGPRVRKPAD